MDRVRAFLVVPLKLIGPSVEGIAAFPDAAWKRNEDVALTALLAAASGIAPDNVALGTARFHDTVPPERCAPRRHDGPLPVVGQD